MSTIGTAIHNVFATIVGLFKHHQFTMHDVQDVITLVQIGNEVKQECSGIKDPAQFTEAVMQSIIKHAPELPEQLKGVHLDATLSTIAQQVLNLPLEEAELMIKAALENHKA